ncbi:MAG: peptidylprolyl isomerase [Planctomycetes bacterium]|nr:peptidylprolyl isomerase [Planctomycetota bacterium]
MFATALLLTGLSAFQDPATNEFPTHLVARWKGGEITSERFDRFLGRNFRGKPLGQEALRHILQIQLVETESVARGLTVPKEAVDERIETARAQASLAGFDLDDLMAQRGLSSTEFRNLLRNSLLHEVLVEADLNLQGKAPTVEQLTEWTESKIESLMAASLSAPQGFALDSPPYRIDLAQLGEAIRRAIGPQRQLEYCEQLTVEEISQQWGRDSNRVLTEDVLQAEIAWRRKRVQENPAFAGMSYEKLLESQGSSLASVRKGRELRAAGWLRLFSEVVYDQEWFEQRSEADQKSDESLFGETRNLSWLFLHAKESKEDPLDLTFSEAHAELMEYRKEMNGPEGFAGLAEQLSEHEASRKAGGQLGWCHRAEPGVIDPQVLLTGFQLSAQQISNPVRLKNGMALIYCSAIRPRPGQAEFRNALRRSRHQELREMLLERYQVEFRWTSDS